MMQYFIQFLISLTAYPATVITILSQYIICCTVLVRIVKNIEIVNNRHAIVQP